MRNRLIALLVLFTVVIFSSAQAQTTARKFEAGKNTFLLDGEPFVVPNFITPVSRKFIGNIVLRCAKHWG